MKKDIFDNNANPFTVPDGYFDTLQERIMRRIQDEENRHTLSGCVTKADEPRIVALHSSFLSLKYRRLFAAAACILFIFSISVATYVMYANKQSVIAETSIDEDFYQWLYMSDRTTLLAESLNITIPEKFANDNNYSEMDEDIIRFLERDNINTVAILYSIDNDTFFMP